MSVVAPTASAPPISRRTPIPAWVLTVAAGLCAAGPVLASMLRALIHGWIPAGDQANIAVRAHDVLTSRTPLVGLHSDSSAVVHHAVYGLGPMLYWLLALPVRIGGPWALTVTMGLLNTAAVVGAVALARRRGGIALMLATALAIVVMTRSLPPEALHDVWNPSAALLPLMLLMFLGWSLASGEHRLLPLTVLTASFVAQCQLVYALPALMILAVGVVGMVVSLRSRPDRPRLRAWVAAAAVVAVACWTPALLDEIKGSPGNLTWVERTVTAGEPTLGADAGWHAVALAIGVRPWWTTDPAYPYERKNEVRRSPGAFRSLTALALLAALLAAAVLGLRRRRVPLWSGAVIALALCAALAEVAAATPTTRLLSATLGYTMWWGSPAGMFVWLIVGWCAVVLAQPALERLRARGRLPSQLAPGGSLAAGGPLALAGLGVVAVAALGVAAGEHADEHLQEYPALSRMVASLDRNVPAHRTVLLLGALGNSTFRFKMAARLALVERGIRPLSPGTDTRVGSWYELDHRRYDCAVYVDDGHASPNAAAVRLAAVTYARRYPLSVWLAPAGCPRGGAAAIPAATTTIPAATTTSPAATTTSPAATTTSPAATRGATEAATAGAGATTAAPTPTSPGIVRTAGQVWVSYPRLLAQARSGPVIRAIINPQRADVELRFRNLLEWHAYYPRAAQPALQRLLRERHIHTLFVARHQPARSARATHHRLRYIALGLAVAALALALAGVLLRRRRTRSGAGPMQDE
jgi:hypothetical protein